MKKLRANLESIRFERMNLSMWIGVRRERIELLLREADQFLLLLATSFRAARIFSSSSGFWWRGAAAVNRRRLVAGNRR